MPGAPSVVTQLIGSSLMTREPAAPAVPDAPPAAASLEPEAPALAPLPPCAVDTSRATDPLHAMVPRWTTNVMQTNKASETSESR